MSTEPVPPAYPRALFLFALFYGGMVCMAGVLGNKLVDLGPLSQLGPLVGLGPLGIEGGIFTFLFLVITASAVAELYGAKTANSLVRIGFVPMIAAMILIRLVMALPPAAAMEPERLSAFQLILGQGARLMFAGLIAYGTSQTLNVTIFSALRGREGNQLLWLRAGIASMASQVVDTLLFITIAFYGVFPIGGLVLGQMIMKVVLSAVLVPPLVSLFVRLGRRLDGPRPA
jgi:uncharacterized integral membrane protein (TIGR00697 family)